MPTYIGKVCAKHPELGGQRRNGNCPQCQREKPRRKTTREERRARILADPEAHRARIKRWREKNYERFVTVKMARNAVRRARKSDATPEDTPEVRRAWAALSIEAKKLGMTIDHIVPIADCRVCGAKGMHEPSNWQLLPPRANEAKGNRCPGCVT
jgi:hypothetical protein